MKKLLSTIMALVMLLSLMPMAVAEEGVTAENAVAQIGDQVYTTLADAVAAVPEDGTETTITLVRDAAGDGVVVDAGKNVIFDFDGHTYTLKGKAVGSTNTKTNGFQLLKGSVVVFKNGTVNIDASNLTKITDETSTKDPKTCNNFMRMIQSYAKVTIEDMTFDATNQFGGKAYVMSFNHDVVNIIGNTNIIGETGKVVFDSDNGEWGGYDKTEPLTKVTVNTTGKIVGDIEVTKGGLNIQNVTLIGGIKLGNEQTPAECITVSGGTFSSDPTAFVTDKTLVVVPSTDGTFTVKPKTSQEGNATTTTEVSEDGKTVTETKTDGNTVTKTETNVDTGAATETKTETKVEGNVTTRTETVTKTDKDGNVTETVKEVAVTETKDTGKTTVTTRTTNVGDKTYTVANKSTESVANGENIRTATAPELVNNEDVMNTDVVVANAPTTASDVTLDAKAAEGYAEKDIPSTVMVEKESLTKLTDDKVNNVIIDTDHATLTLDKTAVKTMESKVEDNGNDKLTLAIKVTEEKAAEEITKIAVEVTAKNEAGQNVFPENTANTNGLINITIPYTGNAKYLDLWYVTANGSATYMGRFPVVNGFVSFDVKHFSQYDLIPVASSGSSVIKTGAGSSAASTTQTVTTDLTPGSITKVTVDGKVVDAKYYTVSGSNVTFTAEFLKTLKNGSHTVTVENATKIAKGVFTVNNPTTAQSPTTADAGIALYAGMAIASVMGTGVVFTSRKRKNY